MAKAKVQLIGLDAAQAAALGLAKGAAELTIGEHAVDFRVHVHGAIAKAPPVEYTPTVDIPHRRAMAFLLQFAGLAGEAALNLLTKAMSAAIETDAEPDLAVIDQAEAMVAAAIGQLPKKVRGGATTVVDELVIERISG